ncbi:condensation domain-containing protein [Kribbella sp. NPDC005582]|uniref:condensation domain-containing protein n=1 Tax=Kribbella sp. NPDC005582 TaxID=3156893 RepID=UPI0033A7B8E2
MVKEQDVRNGSASAGELSRSEASPAGRIQREVPLSYQQQMRLRRDVAFLDANRPIDNHPAGAVYSVTGPFDVVAFEQACGDLLVRHPVLTIGYSLTSGVPQTGYLLDPALFRVRHAESVTALANATNAVHRSAFAPDDFKIQITWAPSTGSETGRILIAADQIAVDGNSWTTLLRDLSQAYELRLRGRSLAELEPAADYAQYAAEQRASLMSAELTGRMAYWRGQLDPLAPFGEEVLAGARRPPAGPRSARQIRYSFDFDLLLAAQETGTTPFSLAMAVHAAVRYVRSGRSVVTTHCTADLRGAEYANSVGWFSGVLVVRHKVAVDDTPAELGSALLGSVFDAVDNAVPLAILQQELEPDRLRSRHWQPMCFLDVRDMEDQNSLQLAGCTLTEIEDDLSLPGLRDGVACWFTSAGQRTDLLMQFEAEAWTRDHAETFVADLEYVFDLVLQDRDCTIAEMADRDWPEQRQPRNKVLFT